MRMETLLRQLLREREIPVHSISSRLKSRGSLAKKVERKGTSYSDLSDVTDLAGLRIVTYFSDQVDEIAGLIESEFQLDHHNSIDKRADLDPDRFGYLSLHYVVSLSPSRAALTEYRALAGLKAEIQIRSILQHAWAEIEHDLGYKTATEVPRPVRRQFARLAGLLELADGEFVSIRHALDEYGREIGGLIATQPSAVTLDKISLVDFVRSNALVMRLDAQITSAFQHSIRKDEAAIAGDVDKLQHLGLKTIADVANALEAHADHIVQLAEYWSHASTASDPGGTMAEGISLFYLCHVLAAATQDFGKILHYLEVCQISGGDESRDETAADLLEFMKPNM